MNTPLAAALHAGQKPLHPFYPYLTGRLAHHPTVTDSLEADVSDAGASCPPHVGTDEVAMKTKGPVLSLIVGVLIFGLGSLGPREEQTHPRPGPGSIKGAGTHFEVLDSGYLNVTLDSSEPIRLSLQSMPEMITLAMEPDSTADSSTISISGFAPETTYHKYEDGYENHIAFSTDASGTYTYTQDLSKAHLVFIQPRKGTKFIQDDGISGTGRDCASIGIWDGATKTCTLTTNVFDSIQINSDFITLNGNGFQIVGSGTGSGILLDRRTGVTIKSAATEGFPIGIWDFGGVENTLQDNILEGPGGGADGIRITGIISAAETRPAIRNSIKRNVVTNFAFGISLDFAKGNSLEGNITTSNTQSGIVVEFNSNGNILTGNHADSNGFHGFRLVFALSNSFIGNTAISNGCHGFDITSSDFNVLTGNTVSGNGTFDPVLCRGIVFFGSDGNTLSRNTISNHNTVGLDVGALLQAGAIFGRTSNNKVYNNNFISNTIHARAAANDPTSTGNVFNFDPSADPSIGGNFWDNFDESGEGCFNTSPADNFCDAPFVFQGGQDNFPWVRRFTPVLILTTSLPPNKLGDFSSHQFEAIGGAPPYSWSFVSGTLPPGIDFSADGILSGTPTDIGLFTFTVMAADTRGNIAEQTVEKKVLLIVPPQVRLHKFGTIPVPGRTVDYFILVENVGGVVARDLEVVELLEPWFTFVAAEPAPTSVIDDIIEWHGLLLAPGDRSLFSYQVRLEASKPVGTIVRGGPACSGREAARTVKRCRDNCKEKFKTPALIAICYLEVCETVLHAELALLHDCNSDISVVVGPSDPNEKGAIAEKFIQPDQTLVYPIHFENIGNAEARDVFVTDQLNANLDLSTLEILTPAGASFDPATRTVRWELLNRNLLPGETDNVLLSVKPLPGLPSGTEIRNDADIQFEVFDIFTTNEVVNIIDSTPPNCVVDPLPTVTATPSFPISWSGTDSVGEIDSFDIFVSVNGGSFTPFIVSTRDTSAVFDGELGKDYGFICVAADTAGNVEDQSLVAEAVTTVFENQPPVAQCRNVTVSADANCQATANVDNGSFDPDSEPITVAQDPPGPYPLGNTSVTLTVTDDKGASDMCSAIVTVVDDTPPAPQCNAPQTIVPKDAPISFTATSTDQCGATSTQISGFDCFFINPDGRQVDKKESCVVTVSDDTVTIVDSGGVGDHITWTVNATDSSGNTSTAPCEVVVERSVR